MCSEFHLAAQEKLYLLCVQFKVSKDSSSPFTDLQVIPLKGSNRRIGMPLKFVSLLVFLSMQTYVKLSNDPGRSQTFQDRHRQ